MPGFYNVTNLNKSTIVAGQLTLLGGESRVAFLKDEEYESLSNALEMISNVNVLSAKGLDGEIYFRDFDTNDNLASGYVDLATFATLTAQGVMNDRPALQAILDALSLAGGGVVRVPARAKYRIDGGDLIIPENVNVEGGWAGDYRVGADWSKLPYCFIIGSPLYTIRLRRNSQFKGNAVIAIDLYGRGILNTAAKGMAAVSAFAGVGITIGDGTTGNSPGNATASCVRDNLIIGFEYGIKTDGSSRIFVQDNRIDCHNGIYHTGVFDPAFITNNTCPMITCGGYSYGNDLFDITNAVDNGSGAVRLTINPRDPTIAYADLVSGYKVVVSGMGGVPVSGIFAITVVGNNQIDLVGSTFSGTYTSGGTVLPPLNWRTGIAYFIENSDGSRVANNFSNNFTVGIRTKDAASINVYGNFCEGYGYPHDGNIGMWIDTGTSRSVFSNNGMSVYVIKVKHDSTGMNNIIGLAAGSGSKSIWITAGEVSLDDCLLEGQIQVEDAVVRVNIGGGNQKGIVINGSAAAKLKVVRSGSRTVGNYRISAQTLTFNVLAAATGDEVAQMTLSEGKVRFGSLPSSASGLSAGELWRDAAAGNVIKMV